MGKIKKIGKYLGGLEWTEKKQDECKFCNDENLKVKVFKDEENQITVFEKDGIKAGSNHWLIIPHHIRDIEGLEPDHLVLLEKLDKVKEDQLSKHYPDVSRWRIHSGYHRGRRPLIRNIYYPDVISVHHLHLHVIIEPHLIPWLFKYPSWLPLMWKSDKAVMKRLQRKKRRQDKKEQKEKKRQDENLASEAEKLD